LGPERIETVVFSWNGYAYTPPAAAPSDQIFTMYFGLLSASVVSLDLVIAQFNQSVVEWYSVLDTTSPPFPTLAEFMQQQDRWQRFRP
jgi:hypothetical protein